jgi:FKBP-type peptidyl-prolyl cis-trans isomerase FkpA
MRRAALVLLLIALGCSGGDEAQPAGAAPEPAPAADEPSAAAPPAEASTPDAIAEAAVGEMVTLPSGVQFTHRVIGTGANPSATDVVTVHYHGTFTDGKVFDSTVDRGQPATFPLNRVIDCWTEAVQLIKVGGKAQIICPPQTAYGANGQPPLIPPNATLQFEVELLAVQ